MSETPSQSTITAWARLMKAQRKALAEIELALTKADMPPLIWYDVLLELERAGPKGLRPFELEREMLMAQYNLSRLIDRMVKAGYVERQVCKDDGRGHVIVVSVAGKILRHRMWPVYAKAIQTTVGQRLSEIQSKALAQLLDRLLLTEP